MGSGRAFDDVVVCVFDRPVRLDKALGRDIVDMIPQEALDAADAYAPDAQGAAEGELGYQARGMRGGEPLSALCSSQSDQSDRST